MPRSAPLSLGALMDALPEPWPDDLRPQIGGAVRASGRKLVVLDDDPTGTQTVHGLPVLTYWSEDALCRELENELPAFFILTNSRSLPADRAIPPFAATSPMKWRPFPLPSAKPWTVGSCARFSKRAEDTQPAMSIMSGKGRC